MQKDIAEILQRRIKNEGNLGMLLSVTKVSVTVDFSVAKVFLSVFPSEKSNQIIDEVSKASPRIRHEVAQKMDGNGRNRAIYHSLSFPNSL